MDKSDYIQKMENVLKDNKIFTRLDDKLYEIDKVERKVITEIKIFIVAGFIDEAIFFTNSNESATE